MDEILRDHEERLTKLEALCLPRKLKLKTPYVDAKAVRASMAEKGWNQSDLARQLGVGKYLVSVWLSGKNRPSPKNWARLQQVIDVV